MLDDLLDLFDRDRRRGPRKRGLGGLLQRLGGDDRPDHDDDRRGRCDRDADRRDRESDEGDYDDRDRPGRRRRGFAFDLD